MTPYDCSREGAHSSKHSQGGAIGALLVAWNETPGRVPVEVEAELIDTRLVAKARQLPTMI